MTDGELISALPETYNDLADAYRQLQKDYIGLARQHAALTSDTYTHLEAGEFDEGATVRRSPVVTDEMVEAGAKEFLRLYGDLTARWFDYEKEIRAAIEAAMRAKP